MKTAAVGILQLWEVPERAQELQQQLEVRSRPLISQLKVEVKKQNGKAEAAMKLEKKLGAAGEGGSGVHEGPARQVFLPTDALRQRAEESVRKGKGPRGSGRVPPAARRSPLRTRRSGPSAARRRPSNFLELVSISWQSAKARFTSAVISRTMRAN